MLVKNQINIQNAVVKSGNPDKAVYKLLSLNRFLCDLLLESCIWDQRLHSLCSSDSGVINAKTNGKVILGQNYLEDSFAARETDRTVNSFESGNEAFDDRVDVQIKREAASESKEIPIQEIPVEGSGEQDESYISSTVTENMERSSAYGHLPTNSCIGDDNCQKENLPLPGDLEVDRNVPMATDLGSGVHDLNLSQRGSSYFPLVPNSENWKGWIWSSFPVIRREYLKDLQRGYVPKYESKYSYTVEHFPNAVGLINNEGSRLHITIGADEYIVSDYEDEFSSIIACALALLKDPPVLAEVLNEDPRREKVATAKMYDSSHSLTRISSLSPHWSSTGSLDADGTHSPPSSEESRLSSFDGLNLLDSLVSFGAIHPEVSVGFGKLPGKSKYSVLCLYAYQFRDLRSRCCPSELDYIASLSRCRSWDAKGGKSKSFFAKTLDDRFIIKEIKKTEFESFAKFAPNYFTYMNECFDQGNQTCLAKILGIYQVGIVSSFPSIALPFCRLYILDILLSI